MPVGTGEWDTDKGAEREVRREFSVGFTGDGVSSEGRAEMVFCCRAKKETEGLGLGEQRGEGWGSLPVWSVYFCSCSAYVWAVKLVRL